MLVTSLLSVFIFGSVFGQFNFNTNTNIGQTLKNVNPADKDTFIVDFSTTKANSTWAYTTEPAYAMTWQKCQTQKGLQVKGFLDAITTTEYKIGTTDCNNWGGNRNPIHVASIDSLKAMLIKSPGAASNGNISDSITRPAACLIDIAPGNPVFSLYPGKVKRQEYWYQYNFSGKSVIDDIQFVIGTLDAGTTGKTATYSLSVATGSESNVVFTKANFYVTGSGAQSVKLAETMGTTPSVFSNQKVYIKINTLGTSNTLNVVDGIAHTVDVNNVPVAYDPQIYFDDLYVTYGTASWTSPAGVKVNDVFAHNNGAPYYVCNNCSDYSDGTPVNILGGSNQPVTLSFSGVNRIGTLVITEANDSHGHTTSFSFAETGAIKKNDGSGNYTIDVPYTRTISETTGEYTITVAAPAAGTGSVNDDIQVTYLQNVSVGSTRAVRLELNNGTRFFYNVAATATVWTANNILDLDKPQIWSTQSSIFVANTINDVQIFNVAGQKVKVATAKEAESGISVQSGIYVIRTGATVQKLIVE